MALTDTGQEKPADTQQKPSEKKEKPFTKVIIRRLPPMMDQESFLNQVSPVPDYDYIYSVKGDFSLGENAFSRVYINFVNLEDIFTFKERFDNYVFLDHKGNEYPAVVEFASFQKIPKKRNKVKPDPKCSSIETDPLYLEFLESLKEQPNSEEKPEFSYQITSENKLDVTTPLLEFVKQRRIDRQRIKEERREERKRKEIERRGRVKDDGRKRFDERSPTKTVVLKPNSSNKQAVSKDKVSEEEGKAKDVEKADVSEKNETKGAEKVHSSGYKKDRKFEDRKGFSSRSKYPSKPEKKEYFEKPDFKPRKTLDERKEREKDESKYNKKVKKYSERREERKNEAKKVEQKKLDKDPDAKAPTKEEKKQPEKSETSETTQKAETTSKNESQIESNRDDSNTECSNRGEGERSRSKENDPRVQRRIRNKDRPTMAIYQPGALSKRRHTDGEGDVKDTKSSTCNKE